MKRLFLILLAFPLCTPAQTINTVFGPNSALYCGGWQSSIAVDDSGNYYVSQEGDNSVYKITPLGVSTKIAGNGTYGYSGDGGPATSAALYEPMGVAVDHAGNVYIADMGNERVRKITPAGIITTVAGVGSGTPGVGGFSGDGGPATSAELYQPAGVYVNATGDLYIADGDNGRIRKVTATGIISTVAGGGTGALGDGGWATSATLHEPISVTFDASGNMYICDGYGGNRIRKVNAIGIISTVAGTGVAGYNGDGIPATTAQLNIPRSVAVSADGTMYISVQNDARIRMVNRTTGMISTIAGTGTPGFSGDGGPSTSAQINIGNIAIDQHGDLIIADIGNHRIRKVNTSVLGVSELNATQTSSLYPNPAGNTLTISATSDIDNLTITDMPGRTIASYPGKGKEMVVDVSQLASGIYFAQINGKEVKQFVKR